MKASRVQGNCGVEKFFKFYALLATRFSQFTGLDKLRGSRRYARLLVTVLRAALSYLFWLQNFRNLF